RILAGLVTGIPAGILRFACQHWRRACGRARYPTGACSSVEFGVRTPARVGLEHFGNRRSGERSQYGRHERGSSAASVAIKWASGCRLSSHFVSAGACAHFRRASRADPAQPVDPPAASSWSFARSIDTEREDSMTRTTDRNLSTGASVMVIHFYRDFSTSGKNSDVIKVPISLLERLTDAVCCAA